MAYIDFPKDLKGQKERKAFWLSPDGLMLIAGWRRNGATVKTIYTEYIEIGHTTWAGWYRESEELRKACATSKEMADMSVEEALYKRAVGYDYWEERWSLIEGELRLVEQTKKHVVPDVKAIMHWLFNRLPNRWRAIQEPLEATQYVDTIKNILVAMKEVAETGVEKEVEASDDAGNA